MAEAPQGYRDIPEADQKKAKSFVQKAKTVAETGQYDYAITLYLDGLFYDPDAVEAHQELRDVSLKRKASGGKDLGMFDKMRLKRPTKDDKQNLLNYEKVLAYDPGNTDNMVGILQNAHRAGYYDTVLWIGPILLRANADSKSPDISKFILLKDIYKDLKQWTRAVEACSYAMRMQPLDMDLQTEMKNLGAQQTMEEGSYAQATSFRQSIYNWTDQRANIEMQKDVVSGDAMEKNILEAETAYKADPTDASRINKLVDALERTEDAQHENRAIEILEQAYQRTRLFSFRHRLGQIKMNQLRRMERSLKVALDDDPKDQQIQKDLEQFKAERIQFELKEYQLWADKYPTELKYRFETATRLFQLGKYDEAIPLLQQARNDPKLRIDGAIWLGRAFLSATFVDEAIDTLQGVIDEYQIKDDARYKEMYYWQGRAFEAKGNNEMAIKRYSQVTQSEFTYRDVQHRIKRLRSPSPGAAQH